MQLVIQVHLRANESGAYGDMQLTETVELNVPTFLEAAKVLGLFHDLTQTIHHHPDINVTRP